MFSLRRHHILRKVNLFRGISSLVGNELVAERLVERQLLRVAGPDSYDLLQGLVTNDVAHIKQGISSMYAMFLSTRGRVLYDTLIYQTGEEGVMFIECDKIAASTLEKHLKFYRLRKKVDLCILEDFEVWVLYNPSPHEDIHEVSLVDDVKNKLLGRVLPCEELQQNRKGRKESLSVNSIGSKNNVLIFRDPRLYELGLRVICPASEDIPKLLGVESGSSYHRLRYLLGVGEGVNDLSPDECNPLEANCDYLHGVSFHKGCYIGQELTARVYYTGVVRKRLMPLIFASPLNNQNAFGRDIVDENEKGVGKLRGFDGLSGLGLLRISEALAAKSLELCGTKVQTMRPSWWPKQAPKEVESKEKL